MTILSILNPSNWFSAERRSSAWKATSDSMEAAIIIGGGAKSAAGINVTPDKAMHLSAVYACIRVISETVGSLPCHLYQRTATGKRHAVEHPLYDLLLTRPNPFMSAMEFFEMLTAHVCLRGNAYATVQRDGSGKVVALWPWHPDSVKLVADDTGYYYQVQTRTAGTIKVPPFGILHIKGLSSDGYTGMSPITAARESIGSAIAVQEYGARFFSNGARPGGVLQTDQVFNDIAPLERLKANWGEIYQGASNAHRVAILEGGLKWQSMGVAPDEAQFLETRKFSRSEIASIFRVPPHLIGDLERATFSNIEHQGIEFVTHCIRPWLVRWEQAMSRVLLLDSERSSYFPRFSPEALLRGDVKSRYEAYAIGRNGGWLNVDEIRDLEDLDPLPEGAGQTYLQPLNMQAVGQPSGDQPTNDKQQKEEI